MWSKCGMDFYPSYFLCSFLHRRVDTLKSTLYGLVSCCSHDSWVMCTRKEIHGWNMSSYVVISNMNEPLYWPIPFRVCKEYLLRHVLIFVRVTNLLLLRWSMPSVKWPYFRMRSPNPLMSPLTVICKIQQVWNKWRVHLKKKKNLNC